MNRVALANMRVVGVAICALIPGAAVAVDRPRPQPLPEPESATVAQLRSAGFQMRVSSSKLGPTVSRFMVMKRAHSWVEQRVPYSQRRYWTNGYGTYRQDCSGFVSMAWRLPDDGSTNYGHTTRTLPLVSVAIPKTSLQPGDALNIPGVHTVLFDRWLNRAAGRFSYYHQPQPGRTATLRYDGSIRTRTLAGLPQSRFTALRYRGIRADRPARVPIGIGADRMYFRAADGKLFMQRYVAGAWRYRRQVANAGAGTTVAVAADGLRAYFTTMTGRIGTAFWGSDRRWHFFALTVRGTQASVSGSRNRMHLFYRDPGGRLMRLLWTGRWHGPYQVATATAAPSSIVSDAAGKRVWFTWPDGRIGIAWMSGSRWHASTLAGFASNLAYVPGQRGVVAVHGRDPSGRITHNYQIGNTWRRGTIVGRGVATESGGVAAVGARKLYPATNGRIGVAWWRSGWRSSVLPGGGSNLTAATIRGAVHVVFTDRWGYLTEDRYAGGRWAGPRRIGPRI